MESSLVKIGKWKLAARTDVPDFRDFIYEPALIKLPLSIGIPKQLNIRDQGTGVTCTGFGLAAAVDLLLSRNGRATTVSPRMIYEMARRYDEWPGEDDEGSSCRGAIKGWYNMGVCAEEKYPFNNDASSGITVDAAKDARNNTIGAYYRLGKRLSDFHAALAETGVIFCSADVHGGWKTPHKSDATILHQANTIGAHAFSIVGYDNRGFWIQNSWGEGWGQQGAALWTYEDWLENIRDAWVFRLALPTPQIWHLPARGNSSSNREAVSSKPTRAEIAGHFVHIDDGQFHDDERYWSNLNDVNQTAQLVAASPDYDHLLLYAHGGLNSPENSACRIAAMKETFKANRIYPYHFMYDTGLLEELKDIIFGRGQKAGARFGDGALDLIDWMIEKSARAPGRAFWREMKAGAQLPFDEGNAGTETLAAFMQAMGNSPNPKKIHLVGHSTGMILLTYLMKRLEILAPDIFVSSVSLMAPAGTVDLFTDQVQPYLKAPNGQFRISKMNIYNLDDSFEQDDEVTKAYNKSLLYLVSKSFEEDLPERLLGMQIHSKLVGRRNLPRLTIHYSDGEVPGTRVTKSETHGGFDNDPSTMNHILGKVLGKKPDEDKAFTKANLMY